MAEDNPEAKKEKPMTFARTSNSYSSSICCLVLFMFLLLKFRSEPACDCP